MIDQFLKKHFRTQPSHDINNSMSNVIEFPIDRRLEQMAIEDGFNIYDKVETAELDTDQYLSEMLSSMFNNDYRVDNEDYVYDISFLYETLKSFVYKMNDCHHPIQHFAKNLYWDAVHPDTTQLEFDF